MVSGTELLFKECQEARCLYIMWTMVILAL